MTLGEKRVRTKFNPSNNSEVDFIKQDYAELINKIEVYLEGAPSEKIRLVSLALTSLEESAMWAVKAITHE